MQSNLTEHQPVTLLEPELPKVGGDVHIKIEMSRNTLIALIVSVLIHLLFLFAVIPKIELDTPPAASAPPIEVSLAPPPMPEVIETPPPVPIVEPPKVEAPRVITQKSRPDRKPEFTIPDKLEKVPEVKPEPLDAPPKDMMEYVRQQQAKRQVAEMDAARLNAEAIAKEAGPSLAQQRDERIKDNLKAGQNGIFEVTSLNSRNATFMFRGWTNDYSAAKIEYFQVEAKPGEDIKLSVVKQMIKLIRKHYQGDFTWESYRLGRSLKMSARLEDNAGLEDFLMQEIWEGSRFR
jgi:hypothetical protein